MADLYHPVKIGNVQLDGNLFLAPIAGYSDRAFRTLCTECGASLCTTEMVSAEALTRGSGKTEDLMLRSPAEKHYAVQIFGGNADVMARAVPLVLDKTGCDIIDINGGCPVPKIIKSGAGSMLTKEPERLFAIVKAVKEAALEYSMASLEYTKEHEGGDMRLQKESGAGGATEGHPQKNVPVTIKIRSGWDSEHITWKECAAAALEAGADAITIHARTRAQGYEGHSDWKTVAALVDFVAGRIPVFGSGDANTPETAKAMLEETGVDAVMFARGAMGDPFLFTRTKQFLIEGKYEAESFEERIKAGFRELMLNVEQFGEKAACLQMRKKFCAYTSGVQGGAELRRKAVQALTVSDYKSIFSF